MLKIISLIWGLLTKGGSSAAAWLRANGRWKPLLIGLCALISALTVTYWVRAARSARAEAAALTVGLRAAQGEVKLLRTAREADAAALAEQTRLRTTIIIKEDQRRAALDKALSANEDWANSPVPAAVIDSLRQD